MDDEPRDQELRLAVVMSGGVSLAIWMGGVTAEVDRLRSQVGAYGDLLALLRQDPVVDIVSGTSAGGLNGVLLATAVANGSSADAIRSVWSKRGDFKELLRPVRDPDPPSLLQGDEYFLGQLDDALHDVRATGALEAVTQTSTATEPVPLHLYVTVSLVQSRARHYVDTTGTPVGEIDHRGTMHFNERALRDPDKVSALALAARSSASFPIAFEPSWLPVDAIGEPAGHTDLQHPDMTGYAWWNGSGFVLDGGLVLNRPLRPALQAIAHQPAARAVRRVVLLVDPNPHTQFDDANKDRQTMSLLDVGKAMVDITKTQSIADDLEELRRHNEQVALQRGLRRALTPMSVSELVAGARPYEGVYVEQRAKSWARDIVTELAARRLMVDERRLDDSDGAFEWKLAAERAAEIRAALLALTYAGPPSLSPSGGQLSPTASEPPADRRLRAAAAQTERVVRAALASPRAAFRDFDVADSRFERLAALIRSVVFPLALDLTRARAADQDAVAAPVREGLKAFFATGAGDDDRQVPVDHAIRNLMANEITRTITAMLGPPRVTAPWPSRDWTGAANDGGFVWAFGSSPLEHAARDALSALHELLNLKPGNTPEHRMLRRHRRQLWLALEMLDGFAGDEKDYWAETVAGHAPDALIDKLHALYVGFPDWYANRKGQTPAQFHATVAANVATAVHGAYQVAASLLPDEWDDGAPLTVTNADDTHFYEELRAEINAVEAPLADRPFVPYARDFAFERRAVLLDVARAPMSATAVPNDEALDLVLLSANARNAFDGRELPNQKLTGLQLNHFGAFYRASWRGNDWMWGRLDAAHHLTRAVLEPARLRRLHPHPGDLIELRRAIISAATGLSLEDAEAVRAATPETRAAVADAAASGDVDTQYLVRDITDRYAEVDRELARLEQTREVTLVNEVREIPDAQNLPSVLPCTSAWITRRIQLGILREELPQLAGDARVDLAAGAEDGRELEAFLERAKVFRSAPCPESPDGEGPRDPTSEEVVKAFVACQIGSDRLADEVHSQLFAEISSQTAAVALNAVSGKSGFTPLRPILGGARGLSKALYRLTRVVRERQPVSVALVGMLSLLGASVIAVSIATGGRLANPIVAIAVPAAAALALAALMRDRTGIGVAAAFAFVIVGWLAGIIWAATLTGLVEVVIALVATLFLLSIVYGMTESRRTAVIVIAITVWVAAIVVSGIAFENAIRWSHVATPGECRAATKVIVAPKNAAAVRKSVLCIEADKQFAARALMALMFVVLIVVGIALLCVRIVRWYRKKRADKAKLVTGVNGHAVAWYTKPWDLSWGAFVDDRGKVVAWVSARAIFTVAGSLCGWLMDDVVRDLQGRVVARVGIADVAGVALLPADEVARRPKPAKRQKRPWLGPVTRPPPAQPVVSPVTWSALVRPPEVLVN